MGYMVRPKGRQKKKTGDIRMTKSFFQCFVLNFCKPTVQFYHTLDIYHTAGHHDTKMWFPNILIQQVTRLGFPNILLSVMVLGLSGDGH